ncbi:MAG: hypothetical protein AAFV33_04440 [Chloroflexota bacterium]
MAGTQQGWLTRKMNDVDRATDKLIEMLEAEADPDTVISQAQRIKKLAQDAYNYASRNSLTTDDRDAGSIIERVKSVLKDIENWLRSVNWDGLLNVVGRIISILADVSTLVAKAA